MFGQYRLSRSMILSLGDASTFSEAESGAATNLTVYLLTMLTAHLQACASGAEPEGKPGQIYRCSPDTQVSGGSKSSNPVNFVSHRGSLLECFSSRSLSLSLSLSAEGICLYFLSSLIFTSIPLQTVSTKACIM